MVRRCVAAFVAAILLSVINPLLRAETKVEDRGCIDGGKRWDYQMVHRIIIWEDNNLSYLEEVPCGSGKWYETHKVSDIPPTTLTNPGVFTTRGTIEFYQPSATAGIVTEGTGPDGREFIAYPATTTLVISAPVVQSLLTSLQ